MKPGCCVVILLAACSGSRRPPPRTDIPKLLITEGGATRTFSPDRDPISIGSGKLDTVILKTPGVVPRHAAMRKTNKGWEVPALDGSPGILVNGEEVSRRGLKHGDKIRIGESILTFHEAGK